MAELNIAALYHFIDYVEGYPATLECSAIPYCTRIVLINSWQKFINQLFQTKVTHSCGDAWTVSSSIVIVVECTAVARIFTCSSANRRLMLLILQSPGN